MKGDGSMPNRKQFKRAVLLLIALYVGIFALRVVYDLITYDDPAPSIGDNYLYASLKNDAGSAKNVASLRMEYAGAGGTEVLDQKYERVASVSAKTVAYDGDLLKLNGVIEETQAVVQMENEQGLPGGRKLSRVIGVKPQYFDACLEAVRAVGMPVSSTLQKTDKTYEYRRMLAQKEELGKRLASYIALRGHEGSVNEKISLEDKIIEVESQLLLLAVDLGEYSDDNALCTINVSLHEGSPVPVARKIWNAFQWTNGCYFVLLGGAVALCLAAMALVKTYRFFGAALTAESKKNKTDE